MNRRDVLGALALMAAGLIALAGVTTPAADQPAPESGHAHRHMMKCAKACSDCMDECESCYKHCAGLVTDGKKEHAKTMTLCADCAEVCAAAARLAGRESELAFPICEACARSCDQCGEACDKLGTDDDHMKACAKACRDCATECRTMIKHLGHAQTQDNKEGEKKE
jgi:hypothetical protein